MSLLKLTSDRGSQGYSHCSVYVNHREVIAVLPIVDRYGTTNNSSIISLPMGEKIHVHETVETVARMVAAAFSEEVKA